MAPRSGYGAKGHLGRLSNFLRHDPELAATMPVAVPTEVGVEQMVTGGHLLDYAGFK